jgi:hypothetical protein
MPRMAVRHDVTFVTPFVTISAQPTKHRVHRYAAWGEKLSIVTIRYNPPMSQFRGKNINFRAMPPTAVNTGMHLYYLVYILSLAFVTDERHTQPVRNQVPRHSGSNPTDDSGNAFREYLEREDKKLKRAESHRAEAHEILIFVSAYRPTPQS